MARPINHQRARRGVRGSAATRRRRPGTRTKSRPSVRSSAAASAGLIAARRSQTTRAATAAIRTKSTSEMTCQGAIPALSCVYVIVRRRIVGLFVVVGLSFFDGGEGGEAEGEGLLDDAATEAEFGLGEFGAQGVVRLSVGEHLTHLAHQVDRLVEGEDQVALGELDLLADLDHRVAATPGEGRAVEG